MASQYLASLSQEERLLLISKLLSIQNHKCFICGKEIDTILHKYDIDHVIPLAKKGKDNELNLALTHSSCNRAKQDSNLEVARLLFKLKEIQKEVINHENRTASLKDILNVHGGAKKSFTYKEDNGSIEFSFDHTTSKHADIFNDTISGFKSVFINVPLEYIYHDEEINPRGINSSIGLLVKEFYNKHPQLHLALARVDDGKIKLFDGQHKAVAQILLGVKEIPLRVFINANKDILRDTNTAAGSKLRQIAFDKAIMRQLNNRHYSERISTFQKDHNRKEDDFSFSEVDLCDYFRGERMKSIIIDSVRNSITYSPENKMRDYIDFEGRGKVLPVSYNAFDKAILSNFINSKVILNTPLDFKSEEGLNPRDLEVRQICKLLSLISEILFINKFNNEVGVSKLEDRIKNGENIPLPHIIACRLSREEIMGVWSEYIVTIIKNYFLTIGISIYDNKPIFQIEFPERVWKNIENFLMNLSKMPLWVNPQLSRTIFAGKRNREYWREILRKGITPDGFECLPGGINIMDMIADK